MNNSNKALLVSGTIMLIMVLVAIYQYYEANKSKTEYRIKEEVVVEENLDDVYPNWGFPKYRRDDDRCQSCDYNADPEVAKCKPCEDNFTEEDNTTFKYWARAPPDDPIRVAKFEYMTGQKDGYFLSSLN